METALRIEIALGEVGQYVDILSEWPDGFRMETKGEISIYREISREQLAGPDPKEILERKEMVENAFARCTPKERELLELRYINGKTLQEIADKEGCTHSNIGNKIQRTLKKIRTIQKSGARRVVYDGYSINDDDDHFHIENTLDPLD